VCGSCEALRASYGLQITPGQHVEGFFVLPKKGASFGIGSGGAVLFPGIGRIFLTSSNGFDMNKLSLNSNREACESGIFYWKINIDLFPKVAGIREDRAAVTGRRTAFGIFC